MSEIKRVGKPPRSKLCPICRNPYIRQRAIQPACSIPCMVELGLKKLAARKRKELTEGRIKLKSRQEWLKSAQAAFNSFIRARDSLLPCISCQSINRASWDAGHYRTTAAAPELRFNELNVHRQCVQCNQHQHGNLIEFRIGLIQRIGPANVDWLEGHHEPLKLTIDDCKALIVLYKAKLKALL